MDGPYCSENENKEVMCLCLCSWNLRSVQDSAWLCPPIPVPRWKSVLLVVPNCFSSDMQCITVGPLQLDSAQGSTKCWTFDSPIFRLRLHYSLFWSMRLWGVLLIFYSLNAFGNKLCLSVKSNQSQYLLSAVSKSQNLWNKNARPTDAAQNVIKAGTPVL